MKCLILILLNTLAGLSSYSQKDLADSIITESLLQQYVQILAHDSMQGRYTGTAGCDKAAAWIAGEMNSINLKAFDGNTNNYFHQYQVSKDSDSFTAANIIGVLPGKILNRYIIFSAHYDHVGDAGEQEMIYQFNRSKKDKIYNGANDNASGVAAMLALAKYYRQTNNNYYSILFIAFSGEEDGLLGSSALAGSFVHTGSIIQVINLEMLGRLPAKRKKPFVTEGINSYGFVKKLNRNLQNIDSTVKKKYFQPDGYSSENYFARSDNYPFASKGVPANTIMATNGFDPHYHSPSDEWQTLDYPGMAKLVQAIALACTPLLQPTDKK